jgi:hypothetical protein
VRTLTDTILPKDAAAEMATEGVVDQAWPPCDTMQHR